MTSFIPEPASPVLRRLHRLTPWILATILCLAGVRLAHGQGSPLRRLAAGPDPIQAAAGVDLVGVAAIIGSCASPVTAVGIVGERWIRAWKGLPPAPPEPVPPPKA